MQYSDWLIQLHEVIFLDSNMLETANCRLIKPSKLVAVLTTIVVVRGWMVALYNVHEIWVIHSPTVLWPIISISYLE